MVVLRADGRAVEVGDWDVRDERKWESDCVVDGMFDVVLLHDRERSVWTEVNAAGTTGVRVVRYSGSPDGGAGREDELWIRARAISGELDALSVDEARDITRWVADGGELRGMPEILRKRLAPDTLCALAVLCQGFFAAHSDPVTGRASGEGLDSVAIESVQAGLDLMGWSRLGEPVRKGLQEARIREGKELERLRSEVRDAGWWRTVVGAGGALEEAVGLEWGEALREQLGNALVLVQSLGGEKVGASDVWKGFRALTIRLGGQGV